MTFKQKLNIATRILSALTSVVLIYMMHSIIDGYIQAKTMIDNDLLLLLILSIPYYSLIVCLAFLLMVSFYLFIIGYTKEITEEMQDEWDEIWSDEDEDDIESVTLDLDEDGIVLLLTDSDGIIGIYPINDEQLTKVLEIVKVE